MSRYDDIMKLIDAGFSDGDIAGMYNTETSTISVYRKAHDGTLTSIAQYPVYRMDEIVARDGPVIGMYKMGVKPKEITANTGMKYGTVRHILEKYRKENGLSKKRERHE